MYALIKQMDTVGAGVCHTCWNKAMAAISKGGGVGSAGLIPICCLFWKLNADGKQ